MRKAIFTYGQLDDDLRALGFTVHTQKGKARIYRHEKTGASVILPDAAFEDEVLPHHLVVARHSLQTLVEDLIRQYKQEHPEEVEDLEVFPPRLYWPHGDGMLLQIGRSVFVIRNNKMEKEIRAPEAPRCFWL